jgi:hypothetical protein
MEDTVRPSPYGCFAGLLLLVTPLDSGLFQQLTVLLLGHPLTALLNN